MSRDKEGNREEIERTYGPSQSLSRVFVFTLIVALKPNPREGTFVAPKLTTKKPNPA